MLMYRAATALAAEDDARADARDDGAAARTAAEERPPKRPVDAAAAASAASVDAGRWANARRRRAAAAMTVGGQEGRKNDVCSILVSAVLRRMSHGGRRQDANKYMESVSEGEKRKNEEKGGAPAFWSRQ